MEEIIELIGRKIGGWLFVWLYRKVTRRGEQHDATETTTESTTTRRFEMAWNCFNCSQPNPDADVACGTCHMTKVRSTEMDALVIQHVETVNAVNAILLGHGLPRIDGTKPTFREKVRAAAKFHG